MVFTGIVEHTATVENIVEDKNLNSVSIKLNKEMLLGLKIGSSISIDGVCLTTTKISEDYAVTDVMMETLRCTTLAALEKGDKVNFESAAKLIRKTWFQFLVIAGIVASMFYPVSLSTIYWWSPWRFPRLIRFFKNGSWTYSFSFFFSAIFA